MNRSLLLRRRAPLAIVWLLFFASADRAVAQVRVMTQNLYVGFDVERYAADVVANPGNVVQLSTDAYDQVLANDFASRATALARQIGEQRPALIGLQEVALFRTAPFDGFGPPHATHVELDYLQMLLDALNARGLPYAAVAAIQNADAEVPRLAGFDVNNQPIVEDVRLTDRDVILARTDLAPAELQLFNPRQASYVNAASVAGIPFPRGWASIDVQAGPLGFRFLTTHLDTDPALQVLQAGELLDPAGPTDTDLPLAFAGDFNSRADGTGTSTYAGLLAAGFDDSWSSTNPGDPGYTSIQDADLRNVPSHLFERIDLVLLRGGLSATGAQLVGEQLADRTPGGLWPSDHAGVVATVVPEPAAWLLILAGGVALVLVLVVRGKFGVLSEPISR